MQNWSLSWDNQAFGHVFPIIYEYAAENPKS